MNPLDVVLLAILLASTVVGIFRGLVREVFGLVSLLVSLVAAYVLAPAVLTALLGEAAGPGAYLAAFGITFVIALVGMALLSRFLTGLLKVLNLGGIDRFLGGVFGAARAGLVTVAALTGLVLVLDPETPLLRHSQILRLEAPAVEWVGSHIPHEGIRRHFDERWARIDVEPVGVSARALRDPRTAQVAEASVAQDAGSSSSAAP